MLFFIVAFNTFCHSQTKQFLHITSNDGLSQSEVYSFLEDSNGYMWFGTVDGLNRYDGYNITIFNTDKTNTNSITNNTIRCLAEDQKGRIWIGTDDGLSVYDSELEKIYQIKLTEFNDKLQTISSILVNKNQLFLGTSMGLFTINIDTDNLEQITKNIHPVKFNSDNGIYNVLGIELSKDESIWFTTSASLYHIKYKKENKNLVPTEVLELKNKFADLRSVKEDNHGNLWLVSHDNGFLRYNPETKNLKNFKKNPLNKTVRSNKISAISFDNDGNLWIGTHDIGLMYLEKKYINDENPNFKIIQHDPLDDRSLNSNLVYSLYVSKSNILWIGTIGSGINIYDPYRKPFKYYNIQSATNQSLYSTNFVRSVYGDISDNIWIGTHNNGLYILDRKNNKKITKTGFETESIFHINEANDGNIIICSGKGISLVKKTNNRLETLNSLSIGPTFYATNGISNTLWIAGLYGIKKCKLINQKIIIEKEYTINSTPEISFNNCRVLFFSKDTNELFVGTEGGGLNVLQLDENENPITNHILKKSNSFNSISNNYIRSIVKDSQSNIWIGTYEGFNKMTTDSISGNIFFKTLTKKDGLPNNTIQSIIEDSEKRLWIGTNKGLSKFNPLSNTFTQYNISEGIQSNEFSEHAIFKKSDDEIIIGGINGINTFYPNKINSSEFKPNTTITDFYLFNKKVSVNDNTENNEYSPLTNSIVLTDTILLKPKQNNLGFEFSAMIYNAPEKIQYAYILDGFDKDWNYTDSKNRRANYTNLGYGDYIFKVKSTNNDGIWEEDSKNIYLTIATPYYHTNLAYILYAICFLGAIVFFTNYTAIRSTTKKKILLENELNKKVRELEEFRTRFFINISHDLRTPLTLISSPLDIVIKNKSLNSEVKNYLNIVQNNVKKLRDMTEELLDIRKLETTKPIPKLKKIDIVSFIKSETSLFEHSIKDKGLKLTITSTEESVRVNFDSDMFSKVIFNLLSNAIKHTQKGEINFNISNISSRDVEALKQTKYNDFVRIQIKDTGAGIDSDELDMIFKRFFKGREGSTKGYGIGLSHSKDLIEAHEGIIEVESTKGEGTLFTIYIPNSKEQINFQDNENSRDLSYETIHTDLTYKISETQQKTEIDQDIELQEQKNESPNTSKIKVLLVEDNKDLRNFIGNELNKTYQVIKASDGEEGLEMAKKHFPDLIVSDIMMPKMNGIDFCKHIKTNIKTSHIPVILLTAKVNKESKYEGIEIGADDYISKPFEIEYLFLRIKNLIENRERLRKLFQVNASLEPSTVTVTSIDETFLSTLMTKIEEGIPDSEFTITALEQELGMSHSSFYNKIKSLTGQSAKELVFNMRMKRAKQVLEDTMNIRISEVAFMVGFSDPKYFSKCFKEYFGKSPSAFVKK